MKVWRIREGITFDHFAVKFGSFASRDPLELGNLRVFEREDGYFRPTGLRTRLSVPQTSHSIHSAQPQELGDINTNMESGGFVGMSLAPRHATSDPAIYRL